jgi:hypothetical protein
MRLAIGAGVLYTAFGVILGGLSGAAASADGRVRWRLAAWALSGVMYFAHLAYEARRHPPRSAAWHPAFGAGIGGLGLAIAAIAHAIRTGEGNLPLLLAAVAGFPVLVTIPAFLVGLAITTFAAKVRRQD